MEEQRARQEEERRRALAESGAPADADPASSNATAAAVASALAAAETGGADDPNTEEALLQRALALSTETENPVKRNRVRECGFFYSFFLSRSIFVFAFYFRQNSFIYLCVFFLCLVFLC